MCLMNRVSSVFGRYPYICRVSCQPKQQIWTSCVRCQNKRTIRSMQGDRGNFQEMGYALLVIPAAAFCLGTWQVQRRKWKLKLIDDLEQVITHAPIDLPDDLEELVGLEYRRVRVRGRYDHSQELYVTPRPPVTSEQQGGGLITGGQSKSGAHVITPFILSDRGQRILINRGWVSRKQMNPETRLQGQVEGEVELVGVVRKTENRQPFGMKNDPSKNQWHWRDQEAMADVLNTLPVLLDADQDSTVPGGPVGGQTRLSLRNEHFSYIVTWYSLATITFLMWYKRYWKIR